MAFAGMATVPRACVSSQKHSVRGMSCRHVATRVVNRRRGFYVRANDLNKWANLDGMDDQCDPNPFDKDTAKVLLRVLTARSVKKLLYQLQELDMVTAQWLNNYAADHPPTTGNEFIEDLFNVQGTVIVDRATNVKRTIDPQNLAHRILQIRNDMAKKATLSLPEFVDLEDSKVMRKHLTNNTFVSGSHTDSSGSTKRRGYYR